MIHRNEEDVVTTAIEAYHRAYGVGNPRTLARAALAAVRAWHAAQPEPVVEPEHVEPEPEHG
jgi:hypothetical protein